LDDLLVRNGRSNNMSGLIHFVSGKTLDISEQEFDNMSPKLNGKGIKCQKTNAGHLIPLNSTTMEFIEHIEEKEEPNMFDSTIESLKKEGKFEDKPEVEPKKTEEEIMDLMIAKSNCEHPTQSLYVQHTAKGVRYFPVCDFCGKRDRYVSEKKIVDGEYDNWSVEDVETAKPWEE
jgi:hypothetical protein